jgi:prefoldin subunit 5
MAQSVKIPVELQIQQVGGQLAELKKALKGVKPDSAAWSKLNGTIEKLEGKFTALERHSKQTFSSSSEIKSFQREFDRLAEGINSVADGFKNLKFDDLLFDSTSKQGIKEAEQKIENIKRSLQSLESINIGKLFDEENTRQFKSLNLGEDIPESYDELIKILKKKNKELSEEIQETQKTLNNLGSKENNLKSVFQDLTTGTDLQVNKIKELFNKYNQTVNFEGGKLKTNIRTTLIEELQNLDVELPKDFLKDLFTGDIEQSFEQSFNTIENRLKQSLNNITKTKSNLENRLKDLNI